jgi:hypothetical protein
MYDDNGCAYNADPLYPDSSRKVQSGAWSFILCEDCENEVNEKYEKPFLKHWYKNKVLDLLAGSRGKIIGGLPYPEFKLFHLLNLFRASLSDHPMFDGFELKPAQMDRLRHMLRVVDPAEKWRFPIVATAIQGTGGKIWDSLIERPHQIRMCGHRGFATTYSGCHWYVLTSERPCPEVLDFQLRESGELPIAVLPLQTARAHRARMNAEESPST